MDVTPLLPSSLFFLPPPFSSIFCFSLPSSFAICESVSSFYSCVFWYFLLFFRIESSSRTPYLNPRFLLPTSILISAACFVFQKGRGNCDASEKFFLKFCIPLKLESLGLKVSIKILLENLDRKIKCF